LQGPSWFECVVPSVNERDFWGKGSLWNYEEGNDDDEPETTETLHQRSVLLIVRWAANPKVQLEMRRQAEAKKAKASVSQKK
jgi:hypothetical protein